MRHKMVAREGEWQHIGMSYAPLPLPIPARYLCPPPTSLGRMRPYLENAAMKMDRKTCVIWHWCLHLAVRFCVYVCAHAAMWFCRPYGLNPPSTALLPSLQSSYQWSLMRAWDSQPSRSQCPTLKSLSLTPFLILTLSVAFSYQPTRPLAM